MYMCVFGITQDHFPNPRNDKNKMTYHSRPGSDPTTEKLLLTIGKVLFIEGAF